MKKYIAVFFALLLVACMAGLTAWALPEDDVSADETSSVAVSSQDAASDTTASTASEAGTATSDVSSAGTSTTAAISSGLPESTPSANVIVQMQGEDETIDPIWGKAIWTVSIITMVALAVVVVYFILKKRYS